MKNTSLLFIGLFLAAICATAGCSEVEEYDNSAVCETTSFESYYDELISLEKISIFDIINQESQTRVGKCGFPCLTKADLNYLSTLTKKEFVNLRDSLILESGGMEILDSLEIANYMLLYEEITENGKYIERIQRLKEFCIDYLTSPQTNYNFDIDSNYLNLSIYEKKIYTQQSAFIDMVTRPIYDHISTVNLDIVHDRKGDRPDCLLELGTKLAIVGLKIGVSGFLDAMTGGADTAQVVLECLDAGVDAMSLWLDYEVCNGRWH